MFFHGHYRNVVAHKVYVCLEPISTDAAPQTKVGFGAVSAEKRSEIDDGFGLIDNLSNDFFGALDFGHKADALA